MGDDTTSFESILANVKKRRADFEPKVVERPGTSSVAHRNTAGKASVQKPSQTPVVNSFNQQHDGQYEMKKTGPSENFPNNQSGTGKTIFVSSSQTGNPLLKSFTNVNWRYVKSSPTKAINYDYQVRGRNVLFLSLKYHKLHPEYISKKLLPLKRTEGNVLLCVVDIENSEDILKELNKLCMFEGFALLLAFTFEQAGKYLAFMNQ